MLGLGLQIYKWGSRSPESFMKLAVWDGEGHFLGRPAWQSLHHSEESGIEPDPSGGARNSGMV